MKKLSIAIILLISSFCFSDSCAQIILPFQSFANPQNLNPAFTGFFQNPRIGLNYSKISNLSSVKTTVNYDQKINILKSGLGLTSSYISSWDGTITMLNFGGFYAYELKFRENSGFRIGINPSYNLENRDMTIYKIGFGPMAGQRVYPEVIISKSFFNIGAGLLGYHENFYAGLSVQNITEPEVKFKDNIKSRAPRTFNLHTGAFYHLTDDLKKGWMLNPNLIIQSISPLSQFNAEWMNTYSLGLNVSKSIVSAGLRYSLLSRSIDTKTVSTMQATLGLNIGNVKVGYSAHLWNTNGYIGPIHEVSLIYQFNKPKDVSGKKMINNFSRIF